MAGTHKESKQMSVGEFADLSTTGRWASLRLLSAGHSYDDQQPGTISEDSV